MAALTLFRTIHLALVLARFLAPAATPGQQAAELIDALEAHLAHCHDYQYVEFEGDLLVHRFAVSNIRENVGLCDSFFSF
jgi:hypothetical protein